MTSERQHNDQDSCQSVLARLRSQQRRRWLDGDRVRAEDLLADVSLCFEPAVDLIYSEFLLREELGDSPDTGEYLERFPQHRECLQRQFAVHQWLESPSCFDDQVGEPTRRPSTSSTFDSPPVPESESESVPSELGDFRLIREIGHGGMGVVYEAEQLSLQRRVALKILTRASAFESRHLARFKSEPLILAQLSHPNIVHIVGVGHDQNIYYYAMDLIEGWSLDEMIDRWRSDPDPSSVSGKGRFHVAADLCRQVAEALEHAHHLDVLHRDIKPSNVLVDGKGKALLTDFGLAKLKNANVTASGDLPGTLRYMSPEQALGRRAEVGERSDIYSLGATLYELATLRPMFSERQVDSLLLAIANRDPPPPRSVNSSIPRDLDTIIARATAKEPGDRYGSAAALAEDLRRFHAGQPILARRPSLPDRLGKWSRRHRGLVCAVAAAICLLTVTLGVSTFLVSRAGSRTATALDRVENTLYVSDMQLAFKAWGKRWTDDVQRILKQHTPDPGQVDRRGVEWYLLDWLTTVPKTLVLNGHEGAVNEIAVFPGGDRVASVGDDATLRIWNLGAGQLISTITTGSEPLYAVAVSPDGQTIATSGHSVILWDVDDGSKRRDLCTFEDNVESLAFSPDGQRIAVGIRYDRVSVYSLDGPLLRQIADGARHESLEFSKDGCFLLGPSRQESASDSVAVWCADQPTDLGQAVVSQRLVDDTANLTLATYSPDGNYVAAAARRSKQALLFKANDGKLLCRLPEQRDETNAVAISPDGLSIVTGHNDGVMSLYVLDPALTGHTSSSSIQAHRGPVTCLRYADARRLVTCSADGTAKIWAIDRSQVIAAGPPWPYVGQDIAYSPDGRQVAVACRQGLWIGDRRNGRTIFFKKLLESDLVRIAYSPRGDVLATCCHVSGAITLWDTASVKVMAQLSHGDRGAEGLCFSPDGRFLATTGRDRTVREWRLRDRKEVERFNLPQEGSTVEYSPDGAFLVCGGDFTEILIWDRRRSRIHRRLDATVETRDLAQDANGSVLASGHDNGTLRLWNIRDGQLIATLRGHSSSVYRIAISPDGKSLASAGGSEVRLWSIPQRREFGILTSREHGEPNGVAFAPDGKGLVVGWPGGSEGNIVQMWNIESVVHPQPGQTRVLYGSTKLGRVVRSAVNPSNGHRYYLITAADGHSGLRWTDAEQTAVALGGHLVTINDEAENDWLISTFGGGNLWIGLRDVDGKGQFAWVSGEPLTYTNWDVGEPNDMGESEDYVHIIYDRGYGPGRWNDLADRTDIDLHNFAIAEVDETSP